MIKNNIKKLLKEKNISILQLSKDIGLSYSNAHALVNREDLGTTSLNTLVEVSKSLKVNIDDLYENH